MDFDFFRSTILALIQGLTEFLPISSSAHLILPLELFGWEDQGLAFDMALHLGTLTAVILYFRKDLWGVGMAMIKQMTKGEISDNSRLGWNIIVATIPVLIAGFLIKEYAETELRNIYVIIATTLFFGTMLGIADRFAPQTRALDHLTWKTSLLIGLAQMFAVIPGTSRSGVTMTAALFCGLKRETAARFSFLLSVPTIGAAGLVKFIDLLSAPSINWLELGYATVVAALTAFVCIHYFLKVIANFSFMPFVIYRLLLGVFLLWLFVL